MDYQSALDFIQNLVNYEKIPVPPPSSGAFKLERVERLLTLLGNPQNSYPAVVIAGTKGKGSTAIMVANVLQAAGAKVGLYTQPHLHTYRERMRIDRQIISREELAELVAEMQPVCLELLSQSERWGMLSAYEAGTALALLYFARQKVDFAVLEIGLGGRLDAVNVVTPLVSAIASLSYDHTAVLGNTLAEIAGEKAGIIKSGVPIVTVPQQSAAAEVIAQVAQAKNSPLTIVKPSQPLPDLVPLSPTHRVRLHQLVKVDFGTERLETRLRLLGKHQLVNSALAAQILWQQAQFKTGIKINSTNLQAGFSSVEWSARLQVLQNLPGKSLIVADGAHNAASIASVKQSLTTEFYFDNLWLVVGIYRDKDIAGIFEELARPPQPAGVILCRSRSPRASLPEDLARQARLANLENCYFVDTVADGIKKAQALAAPLDLILITGSLSVAAEAEELFPTLISP